MFSSGVCSIDFGLQGQIPSLTLELPKTMKMKNDF